ncbi:MAG: DUF5110 domain-containing protein [Clostridia bacterium]|nr:DUF5110 domain-containing protein [Clostridia bacterium]
MKKITLFLLMVVFVFALCIGTLTACKPKNEGESGSLNGSSSSSQLKPPADDDDQKDGAYEILDESISAVRIGDVRVQLLSSTLVRIENEGRYGFEDRPSYIVSNRTDWGSVEFTVEENSNEVTVVTANYTVHVQKGKTAESAYITNGVGEELWAFADAGMTDTNVYLPSPSDELKSWYFTDSPRIIPSEYGYTPTDKVGELQDWDFSNDQTDIFVFLPQGNYQQFCTDYTSLTGESEMVSLQMLGYWDSRWYAYSSETALQQIKDYTDRGYSIDVLVIDTDWRNSYAVGGVGYEINTDLFPDMAGFLEQCHELGVNICFNDHPEPVRGTNNGLNKSEVEYRSNNLTLILSLGLDYWWYDRNWSVCLNSCDPDISVFAFGMYAYNWVTTEYLESITDLGEYAERALIMGNVDGCLHGKWNYASDISAHRYAIQWTGDIGSDTAALSQEIYAAVFGGAEVGLPYMSSDIGGHTTAVTDSMYSRWIQYGALSTICRVHCTNYDYCGQEGRMPWLFGETAEEVTKAYVGMRYRLLPVYYSLAYQNYETGLPIMRRLDINYPEYVESQNNDQYLIGDYILVAPITEGAGNIAVNEDQLSHNGKQGLKAEYYNNDNWSGTPSRTQVDKNINFNWGTSGPSGVGADYFSVRWTGEITIGKNPAALSFFADDAILVYLDGKLVIDGSDVYDKYLSTEVLAANSTHTLEVKYAEFGYNAHVYMYYIEQPGAGQSICYNSRSVFIPEGTWIDVWSGKRYVGPKTYTVTHPLETSPIFVREGALIPLAQNMTNTNAKDWSEMSLEVYPSKNYTAKATLYEDDTVTVGYKHGQSRTTDITMEYNESKKAIVVTINGANGSFEGEKAFSERTWNIRIHNNPGWGDLNMVKLNGKMQSCGFEGASESAMPFAFTGSARDGDIYTLNFTANVNQKQVIEIYYASLLSSEKAAFYDATSVAFDIESGETGDAIDLSSDQIVDYISFGDNNANLYTQKPGADSLFTFPTSYDVAWRTYDNFFVKKLADGSDLTSGIASQKDFSFTIKTLGQASYYVVYVGGNMSTAKFTVRDRAGNVRTLMVGNIDGNYLKRIVISCPTGTESTLYVTYSMVASEPNGTGTLSSVSLIGAFACYELPELIDRPDSNITAFIRSSTMPTQKENLSNAGASLGELTMDWMQFGEEGSIGHVQKINADIIEEVVFRDPRGFSDYPIQLSYTDGAELGAHTGTRKGTCSPGSITLKFKVNPQVKHIILYTGAWLSTNTVEVYTQKGTLLCANQSFKVGGIAEARKVVIALNVTEKQDTVMVLIRSTFEGSGGNVNIAGVAVTGTYSQPANVQVVNSACDLVSGEIDISDGAIDWVHFGSGDSKSGGDAIGQPAYSGWTTHFNDYASQLGYADGASGAASGLTSGIAFDYATVKINLTAQTTKLLLYASVFDATAGISIIDEQGRTLYAGDLHTDSDASIESFLVQFDLTVSQNSTITLVYYKGGSGSGNAGIAAIALK